MAGSSASEMIADFVMRYRPGDVAVWLLVFLALPGGLLWAAFKLVHRPSLRSLALSVCLFPIVLVLSFRAGELIYGPSPPGPRVIPPMFPMPNFRSHGGYNLALLFACTYAASLAWECRARRLSERVRRDPPDRD